jgi:hypothetical protein
MNATNRCETRRKSGQNAPARGGCPPFGPGWKPTSGSGFRKTDSLAPFARHAAGRYANRGVYRFPRWSHRRRQHDPSEAMRFWVTIGRALPLHACGPGPTNVDGSISDRRFISGHHAGESSEPAASPVLHDAACEPAPRRRSVAGNLAADSPDPAYLSSRRTRTPLAVRHRSAHPPSIIIER